MSKKFIPVLAVALVLSSASVAHAEDAAVAPKAKGPGIITRLRKEIKKPFKMIATGSKLFFAACTVISAAAEKKLS